MDLSGICLNCFSQRGAYDVCPYCGYVAGTAPDPAYLLTPGTLLQGRYVVGTVLGVGGFGATYKAWDTTLNILVAVKEFYPGGLVNRIPGQAEVRVFSGDKQESYGQQLARFLDEARNMARFAGDEHIVGVFDFFEANNTAYIVMEYLQGLTLKEYMASKGGRLPAEEAVAIAEALLGALQNIHDKDIIHRDISPDNIFILHDGRVKVLDFGAARFAANENAAFTQAVVIKMGYAPPEQYRANMKQGPWTDIYATGATLFKMLTGITPDESVDRLEKDTLRRPTQMGLPTDTHVEKTIMKAMALKPELRFKSATAMLGALKGASGVDFPEQELKKRRRNRAVVLAAAAVAAVALVVVIALQAARGGGEALPTLEIPPTEIEMAVSSESTYEMYIGLAEAFNEQYPEHNVTVTITESTVLELLASADPPAMVRPTGVDVPRELVADLTPLYESLGTRNYWFLDKYEDYYPQKTKMPLVFNCLAAYGNQLNARDAGIDLPKEVTSFAQLDELCSGGQAGTIGGGEYISPYLLFAQNPGFLYRVPDADLTGDAERMARMWKDGALTLDTYFSSDENDVVVCMGWLGGLRDVQDKWAGYYQVIPVTAGGGGLGIFGQEWCISAGATEDEQALAMLFIHFMLSEHAQNILCVQNDNNLPLNKNALDQYRQVNPEVKVYSDGILRKLNLYGEDRTVLRARVEEVAEILYADSQGAGDADALMQDWLDGFEPAVPISDEDVNE